MKDDIKLQRALLKRINDTGYWADHDDLVMGFRIHDITSNMFNRRKKALPKVEDLRHQLKLLEDKGQVRRTLITPHIRYEMTVAGHQVLRPWYAKVMKSVSTRLDSITVSAITSIIVYLIIELIRHWLNLH